MENVYLWSEPRLDDPAHVWRAELASPRPSTHGLDLRAYSEPGQYVVTTVVVRIISYGDHTFQML